MYSNDLQGDTWESYVTRGIGANVPQKELNGHGRKEGEHISYIQKLKLDDVGGTDLQRLDTLEMPSHTHALSNGTQIISNNGGKMWISGSNYERSSTTANVSLNNTGGGESHNNTPPYYVLVYIIKL